MKYKSKSGKKQIFATIITLAVIVLLIFAGPASAINLGLNEFSDSTPTSGDIISTTATIEMNSNDRMSMPNPAGVFIDNALGCAFGLTTESTSCSSSGITVTLLSTSDANGYGYSYNHGYGYGYNYGYANGYGYGYGYQQGYTNSKFTYNITIDTSYYTVGEHKIKLAVNVKPDPASQVYSSEEQTITIGLSEGQQYADSETVTVGDDTDEIVFDSGSSDVRKIVIPSSIPSNKSITLDLSALLVGNTVTLPNNLTIVREAAGVNYTAFIPAGTVITGPSGWDGKITLPTLGEPSAFTSDGTIDVVINLGSVDELTFSNAVEVVLGGMAGKKAAWTHGTVLTTISTVCDGTHSNINSTSPRECSIDSGSDLDIWTYHFTSFGAYTPVTVVAGVSGGSGGAYKPYVKPSNVTNSTPVQNNVNEPAGNTSPAQKGFISRITGAVIGALGTTGTTVAIVFIVVIIIALVVVSRRNSGKKGKKGKKDSDEDED